MRDKELSLTVSAVIPTRNRPNDLLRAVESVIRQSHLPNQLLIIDQSQDDKSMQLVRNLFEKEKIDSELIYIHDISITGLVHAKDVGVKKSSGDVVMFLEDDVILGPDYIHSLLRGFIDSPTMMGTCGVMTEVSKYSKIYQIIFNLFHRGFFRDPRVTIHGNPYRWDERMIPSNYLSGGLSAFRREVFDTVPFDIRNEFFMLEDIDFSTRAERTFGKGKFFINTEARLDHLFSPINRAVQKMRYHRKMREYVVFYKKNCDRQWVFPAFIWLLVGCFLEAGFEATRLRSVGPMIGMVKGLMQGIRWEVR